MTIGQPYVWGGDGSSGGRHPGLVQLLRFFESDHLPRHLQAVSAPCGRLAHEMADTLTDSPELTAGVRKLLEAKDCFVRAALSTEED